MCDDVQYSNWTLPEFDHPRLFTRSADWSDLDSDTVHSAVQEGFTTWLSVGPSPKITKLVVRSASLLGTGASLLVARCIATTSSSNQSPIPLTHWGQNKGPVLCDISALLSEANRESKRTYQLDDSSKAGTVQLWHPNPENRLCITNYFVHAYTKHRRNVDLVLGKDGRVCSFMRAIVF